MKHPFHFLPYGVSICLQVQPGSSSSCFVGLKDDCFKVKLKARALEGQANKALVEFLSAYFKLPKSSINIVRGERSRNKTVTIWGEREGLEQALTTLVNEVPRI